MAATPAQLRTIREGLQEHVWLGAQADELREIVAAYARSLDLKLTDGELASLLRKA
jgi:hypothetical protein